MARIFNSANDPLDFCNDCMPSWEQALRRYSDVGDGPDGRGNCFEYETDHPEYGGLGYTCETCGETLTDKDN